MRRFVVGAALLVLVVLVAGCGGDPKADPSPSRSSAPSASSTPMPTPPALPDAAKANTKAGAIAFVKYYVELLNYLEATGDDEPALAVSADACKSCQAVVRAARAIYDSGGHMEGGAWTVHEVTASQPTPGLWSVRIRGQLAPSTVFESSTSTPKSGTGGRADAEFFVSYTTVWKVGQWHTG